MKVLFYIKQCLIFFYYLLKVEEYKFYTFPYKDKCKGKKAFVLGNGPSLKNLLNEYELGHIKIPQDSFFVNMSPLNDSFYKIKPKYLLLSDFVFARDTSGRTETVRKMYSRLDTEVDWDLTIFLTFIRKKYCDQLITYSKIKNKHIKFVFLNRKYCDKLCPNWRNWLYHKGWFMPEEGTVVNTAIYAAILCGYSEINLYGVDHNMFLNMEVDDNNVVYMVEKHFYGKSIKVRMQTDNQEYAGVGYFLYCMYVMFNSHRLLREFADSLGIEIYNCTPNSMLDTYKRKKIIYEYSLRCKTLRSSKD